MSLFIRFSYVALIDSKKAFVSTYPVHVQPGRFAWSSLLRNVLAQFITVNVETTSIPDECYH
jgi:hypothetical protein